MARNQISNKIVLSLLDRRSMSSRDLVRYLNVGSPAVNAATFGLRKRGLIEHTGYSRFSLTEAGKEYAGRLLAKESPAPVEQAQDTSPTPEQVPETRRDQDCEPAESNDIDWSKEYIRLTHRIVDALVALTSKPVGDIIDKEDGR